MDAPGKKSPIRAAVARAADAPYTQRSDRKHGTMNGGAHEVRITDLDRKLTEGLNLVHGQLAGLAEDVREDRREFRAGFARLDARIDRLETRMEEQFVRLETRMEERFAKQEAARKADTEELREMIRDLSREVRRATEQSATALERSTGFSWMRRRLAAGILLLLAGGLLAEIGRLALGALAGR